MCNRYALLAGQTVLTADCLASFGILKHFVTIFLVILSFERIGPLSNSLKTGIGPVTGPILFFLCL